MSQLAAAIWQAESALAQVDQLYVECSQQASVLLQASIHISSAVFALKQLLSDQEPVEP